LRRGLRRTWIGSQELQLLLHDAERERVYLDGGGIDTTLQDEVIAKLEEEIRDLSRKIR
jgi:hypothetical protein